MVGMSFYNPSSVNSLKLFGNLFILLIFYNIKKNENWNRKVKKVKPSGTLRGAKIEHSFFEDEKKIVIIMIINSFTCPLGRDARHLSIMIMIMIIT